MYLPLGPSSPLRLPQYLISLVAGIAAAVFGIAWQLLGQRPNVGQRPVPVS